ncbi:NAD(P)/FAD-dependent oxidoreductase [Lacihabitans sp. LS3-19]|uniref:NAD(P)/FAD-dependent oxidoreductase n=1 Tax=Lacihabitans sp. LS3-19 TaxID=2487335 RepID=UPI0020CDB2AB|nr:NAD(P)/FAD-dependent oxidoreductase [Lacihabitans sp. LS3-19]MCP9769887.1 NAD(P)/FAD-dependent oxidoreductase [Lacihabitans sp. LS3-19]
MEEGFTYDVVILGGGVAGCATAIALKNHQESLKIAILERDGFVGEAFRVGETLPPHAGQQLQHLGIFENFNALGFNRSFGTSSAWGSSELKTNEFLFSPFGYGWNIDRGLFDQFMINEAKSKGVTFFHKTSCYDAAWEGEKWNLKCKQDGKEKQFIAKFVVDATGKKSAFSKLQGASKLVKDQLIGIYRYYSLKNIPKTDLQYGTCIETNSMGWWYSATLPNDTLVLSYLTDADIANDFQFRKTEVFDDLMKDSNYTFKRIKGAEVISEIKVVAAHTQYLNNVVGKGWLAVGDAASSYDPISSLGIFKSLIMSRFAAFSICDNLKGDVNALKKYEHIVKQDFEAYQSKKTAYYNQEIRFKNHFFWKRRQSF